jgi:hypothetical protein
VQLAVTQVLNAVTDNMRFDSVSIEHLTQVFVPTVDDLVPHALDLLHVLLGGCSLDHQHGRLDTATLKEVLDIVVSIV